MQSRSLFLRVADFGRFWRFVWQVLICRIAVPRQGPAAMSRGRLLVQMFEIGTKSVPVVMITGAFVAMTLAIQSYSQLKSLGMEDRLGNLH